MTKERLIDIEDIDVSNRNVREVNLTIVEYIKTSIKEHGLMHMIQVNDRGESVTPRYNLCAGAHRLAAMKALGNKTIKANIHDNLDNYGEVMIEVSENLFRKELNSWERMKSLAILKAAYLETYPETAHGKNKGNSEIPSFVSKAAGDIDYKEATIRRDITIFNCIVKEAHTIIERHSDLYLSRKNLSDLSRVEADKQVTVAVHFGKGDFKDIAQTYHDLYHRDTPPNPNDKDSKNDEKQKDSASEQEQYILNLLAHADISVKDAIADELTGDESGMLGPICDSLRNKGYTIHLPQHDEQDEYSQESGDDNMNQDTPA